MRHPTRPAIPGHTPAPGGRVARAVCAVFGHIHRRKWSNPDAGARCPRCGRTTSVHTDKREEGIERTRRELLVSVVLALCSAAAAIWLVAAIVTMLLHTAPPE